MALVCWRRFRSSSNQFSSCIYYIVCKTYLETFRQPWCFQSDKLDLYRPLHPRQDWPRVYLTQWQWYQSPMLRWIEYSPAVRSEDLWMWESIDPPDLHNHTLCTHSCWKTAFHDLVTVGRIRNTSTLNGISRLALHLHVAQYPMHSLLGRYAINVSPRFVSAEFYRIRRPDMFHFRT